MSSKDFAAEPIMSSEQLLASLNSFLADKFAVPAADSDRQREQRVSQDDPLLEDELEECLDVLKDSKAPGFVGIPIDVYKNSECAKHKLFRVTRLIWDTELVPPDFILGFSHAPQEE